MKRVAIRRHPHRSNQVTAELWQTIVQRDAWQIWQLSSVSIPFPKWRRLTRVICVPGYLDPQGSVNCSDRQTVEHVKDELRMGKRAPSDERHLVASCWWHNSVHPSSKELRYEMRSWLRRLNP